MQDGSQIFGANVDAQDSDRRWKDGVGWSGVLAGNASGGSRTVLTEPKSQVCFCACRVDAIHCGWYGWLASITHGPSGSTNGNPGIMQRIEICASQSRAWGSQSLTMAWRQKQTGIMAESRHANDGRKHAVAFHKPSETDTLREQLVTSR
jgi:hypothetical protein